MNVLLNYANRKYKNSQCLNRLSAEKFCSFDQIRCLGRGALDLEFINRNAQLLRYSKGNGYWVWKPYLIWKTLLELQPGDRLFYCDSGSKFIGDAVKLLDLFDHCDQDLIVFRTMHPEKFYTKLDAFRLMSCEGREFIDSPQICASFIALRRSAWSLQFCKSWSRFCENEDIVTDTPNRDGRDNPTDYIESKGDQSVLSLLVKQEDLTIFRDPSQFGNCQKDMFQNSPYPQLIDQTWLVPEPRRWLRAVHRGLDAFENYFLLR